MTGRSHGNLTPRRSIEAECARRGTAAAQERGPFTVTYIDRGQPVAFKTSWGRFVREWGPWLAGKATRGTHSIVLRDRYGNDVTQAPDVADVLWPSHGRVAA